MSISFENSFYLSRKKNTINFRFAHARQTTLRRIINHNITSWRSRGQNWWCLCCAQYPAWGTVPVRQRTLWNIGGGQYLGLWVKDNYIHTYVCIMQTLSALTSMHRRMSRCLRTSRVKRAYKQVQYHTELHSRILLISGRT